MHYSYTTRVRFSELDHRGRVNEAGVINFFQDASTFQSEALGVGVDYLFSINRVWVLNSWNIVFERDLKLGDEIVVTTWPCAFKGLLAERDFTITLKTGEMCAKAMTNWAYVNLATGRPERIDEEAKRPYPPDEPLELPKADRKIRMPQDMEERERFRVQKRDLDENGHVNNGKYVAMALEYLDESFCTGRLRVEYKKQAHYGDVFCPKVKREGSYFYVAMCDEAGKTCANMCFEGKVSDEE
ncbi:MAG: thioesterase [Lachnospiraceae bacterium]|nr:thioesterase [Lachnospiraceae bacterium]